MIKCGITGSQGNLGKTFLKTKNFDFIKFNGDISKKADVIKWINKNEFDIIIHFAAIVPTIVVNKNYQRALKVNYVGTKYLVDAILRYIKWFFFASTSHVYPLQTKNISEKNKTKPLSKYGKTKLKAENYIIKKLKNKKYNFCVGRIFSIFDNKGKGFFTPSLLGKVRKGNKYLLLENLNHYRDFLTTKQISKIIIFLCRKKFTGIINIGSGEKTNLQKIAKIFAKKAGKKVLIKNNKPSYHVANISKLKRMGYKIKKLNFRGIF